MIRTCLGGAGLRRMVGALSTLGAAAQDTDGWAYSISPFVWAIVAWTYVWGVTDMRSKLVLAVLMAAALAGPGWAAGEIGRIKTTTGAVSIFPNGNPKATPAAAKAGLLLKKGDLIKTGKDGNVGITFLDNSRFAVGPNTTLSLTEFEFDQTTRRGRFETRVDKGTVAVVSGLIAKENRDAMKVRTPVSVLAARGTRFVVEVP